MFCLEFSSFKRWKQRHGKALCVLRQICYSFSCCWFFSPLFLRRVYPQQAVAAMNELLQKSFAKGMSYVDLKKSNLPDVEMGGIDAEKNLAHFFEEVGQIKGEMERVKELLMKLQDANDECKTVHRAQTMKTLRERMDKDIAMVSELTASLLDPCSFLQVAPDAFL